MHFLSYAIQTCVNVEVYIYSTVPCYANPCLFNRPIWTYSAIETNVLGTPILTCMCYPDYTLLY